MLNDFKDIISRGGSIWVFGYGSLLWKPDFDYNRRVVGKILGFKRRFWQGSTTHRGSYTQPGRVATLIEDDQSLVWGAAFEITGEEAIRRALGGLTKREITLGGYDVVQTVFYPRNGYEKTVKQVYMYVATSRNDLYLGEVDFETMATQIATASGFAGSNVEYITRLADYVREHIPEDDDRHLFALDKRIREIVNELVIYNNSLPSDELDSGGETDSNETDSVIGDTESFEHLQDVEFLFLRSDDDNDDDDISFL